VPGSVTHLPELLSHTYRNRVPKLSPSNRNPSDHHEPERHTALLSPLAVNVAFTLFALTLAVRELLVIGVRPAGIEPATKCLEGTCSIR
jgi:hypothetical protein